MDEGKIVSLKTGDLSIEQMRRDLAPQPGCAVLYVHRAGDARQWNKGTVSPALVSRVIDPPGHRCKLHVLVDDTDSPPFFRTEAEHDEDGRAPGTWHWNRYGL